VLTLPSSPVIETVG